MYAEVSKEGKALKNVAIVSLSSGIIGEPFIQFEVDIGLRRLKEYGLNVRFMPNALKGMEYIKAHPEKEQKTCCRHSAIPPLT